MKDPGIKARVLQEFDIHPRLVHPSILEVLAYFENKDYIYLVVELCTNGELQKYVRSHPMSEEQGELIFVIYWTFIEISFLMNHIP
jgi:polo-like kinase 4